MKGEVAEVIRSASNNEESEGSESPSEMSEMESEDETAVNTEQPSDVEEAEEAREGLGQLAPIRPAAATNRKQSMISLSRARTASFSGPRGRISDEEDGNIKSKQTKETSEQGKVKWEVYKEYAKTSNLYAVTIYLVALLSAQTAQVGGNIWLKHWSEVNERESSNPNVGKFIGIYFALGIGGAALVVVQTLILWIFCSIEAARKLHERMASFDRQ